ncbi:NAD-dependent epimerase/dehydratase family protein [Lichenicoccus sp.]|uniref:NAD-dependent epimerase/dehydratase family protein n=1 Tax=Lichenicoccus sp. TaxID=2781899 RepID=UPI003D0EB41F
MTSAPVLVTGASGFVGLSVLEHLLALGRDVVALSSSLLPLTAVKRLAAQPGRLVERLGDIREPADIRQALAAAPVTGIIHLAAVTSGIAMEAERAWDSVTVNLGGLTRLLRGMAEAGVPRLVLASSVAVYGASTPDGEWLDEERPTAPATLYAITKASGETLSAHLAASLGLDCRIGRLGRVFGPMEYESGVRDTLSQIHTVTTRAKAGLHAHLPRPCLKNWHYAADAAASLVALLDLPAPLHTLYNLGTPHVFALADWCARLREVYPRFSFSVGDTDRAAPADIIDLWGRSDGGLLSWQRFAAEANMPCHHFDAAFDDYMQRVSGP